MKKTYNLLIPHGIWHRRAMMYMKMTFAMILMSMLTVSAKSFGQQNKFAVQVKEANIIQVLEEIEQKSGFGFVFQTEEVIRAHV